jgi:hypothetical protein
MCASGWLGHHQRLARYLSGLGQQQRDQRDYQREVPDAVQQK